MNASVKKNSSSIFFSKWECEVGEEKSRLSEVELSVIKGGYQLANVRSSRSMPNYLNFPLVFKAY